jgi:cation:H+ antiporter
MNWLIHQTTSLTGSLIIFALSAVVVWLAGTRLAQYSKTLSDRLGDQPAFIGVVLLGVVVSLPEMTMAGAAAMIGNAALAINLLLGGVAVCVAILAITDAAIGREPLSSDIQYPIVFLQGTLVILLMVVAAMGLTVGDVPVFGAGLWSTSLLVIYVLALVVIHRLQKSQPWKPQDEMAERARLVRDASENARSDHDPRSSGAIIRLTIMASVVVIIAGSVLAYTADRLATQTGLGASFIGFVLGGLVTSLPELSSTIAAVRLGEYEMVFSDAFGTNLCSLMLIFVTDLIYQGPPVLNELGSFSLVAILLGVAVTTIYLAGLIVRPKNTFLGMGFDSLLVLCTTGAGMLLLYYVK